MLTEYCGHMLWAQNSAVTHGRYSIDIEERKKMHAHVYVLACISTQ